MKKTRRFAATIAAMALAATMVAPTMMNASAASGGNNRITVTDSDGATHTYAAYQIFKATYSDGVLTSIEWGDGVNSANLLTAIIAKNSDNNSPLKGLFNGITDSSSADDVAKCLGATETEIDSETGGEVTTKVFGDKDSPAAQAFAELVGANLGTASGLTGLPDGYYLVQDSAAPSGGTDNSGAKTRYIIDVVGGETVSVTAKHAAPTVDKEVEDETDEVANTGSVFGEAADHAINESFKFKLTATLAKDADYAAYDTYRVLFTDTLNAGVTYERIESVKVNGNDVTEYVAKSGETDERTAAQKAGYKVTAPTLAEGALGGGTLTISIGDIKQWIPSGEALGSDAVTVEVIYNAHLNENATVEKNSVGVDVTYANVNKVKLNYSNNPNVTGTGDSGDTPGDSGNNEEFGETPEDYVWVFTYEIDNKKVDENNAPMAGAGFTLYSDAAKTQAVKLIYNGGGTYTVADQNALSGTVEQMFSFDDTDDTKKGIFNIKGLDAGTYYLVETTVPAGYNKCDDITIGIGAGHTENANKITAKLELNDQNSTMDNTITNEKGSSLPSTGGMGTKLFIAGGGITATLAALYLVTKKRSGKEEE